MKVTTAQLIRPYVGPQYLVEPIGDPSDDEDIAAIQDAVDEGAAVVLDDTIMGWPPYTHIIGTCGEPYLVAVET